MTSRDPRKKPRRKTRLNSGPLDLRLLMSQLRATHAAQQDELELRHRQFNTKYQAAEQEVQDASLAFEEAKHQLHIAQEQFCQAEARISIARSTQERLTLEQPDVTKILTWSEDTLAKVSHMVERGRVIMPFRAKWSDENQLQMLKNQEGGQDRLMHYLLHDLAKCDPSLHFIYTEQEPVRIVATCTFLVVRVLASADGGEENSTMVEEVDTHQRYALVRGHTWRQMVWTSQTMSDSRYRLPVWILKPALPITKFSL